MHQVPDPTADRPGAAGVERLLRESAPYVLGALVRRYGVFDAAEDAVQEALLAAAVQWPEQGVPGNPRGWLLTVAGRRLADQVRGESARRRRENAAAALVPGDAALVPPPGDDRPEHRDDTLALLFLCCHPALTPPSQVALTLRAVGGLTTGQIARAFLVPETTMAQRISRAKQRIRAAGARFALPGLADWPERLRVVLHVLYLVFNEGYTATSGDSLHRVELTAEAIRLTRALHRLLPGDTEVAGLLALMLLVDARRAARLSPRGDLVPLDEQDRDRWDRAAIAEGVDLVTAALRDGPAGPYQIQAAIAALHGEARRARDTDWPQILALYEILGRISPSPVVTLNHAIAAAMARGPAAGLAMLDELDELEKLDGRAGPDAGEGPGGPGATGADHRLGHRLTAVRAHLLEMTGDRAAAREGYLAAARATASIPERRYLQGRAARLAMAE